MVNVTLTNNDTVHVDLELTVNEAWALRRVLNMGRVGCDMVPALDSVDTGIAATLAWMLKQTLSDTVQK